MGKNELSVPFSLRQFNDLFICYMSCLIHQFHIQRAADLTENLLFGKSNISLEPDSISDVITRIVKMQIRFLRGKLLANVCAWFMYCWNITLAGGVSPHAIASDKQKERRKRIRLFFISIGF